MNEENGFVIEGSTLKKYNGDERDIIVPSGVTEIGYCAFEQVKSMESLKLSDNVSYIADRAIYNCENLKRVSIGKGVKHIGTQVFYGCHALAEIKADEQNETYRSGGNCIIETKEKTVAIGFNNSVIPTDGSVNSIGRLAFDGRRDLVSIEIPDSVSYIGSYAFFNCASLESVMLPGNVPTTIERRAFAKCTALKTVILGEKVISIEDGAFENCETLSEIVMPGVWDIGDFAFLGCKSLKSIALPSSVNYIGSEVFSGCDSLTDIYFGGTKEEWEKLSKFCGEDMPEKCVVHCTDGNIEY